MNSGKALMCALILLGNVLPASAGITTYMGKVYDKGLEYATVGVAAYPFIETYFKGVEQPAWWGLSTMQAPLVSYLQTLSRPELLEFVKQTGNPYVPYAVAILLGGYAAKKTAKYAFDIK